MKTVILATDFSPSALNAANYAADLATSLEGELLLMHTNHHFESDPEMPPPATQSELERDANEGIQELKKNLKHKYGNLNIKTKVGSGPLVKELKQLTDEIKPYCVVMGSQGASASDYRNFGSQTVQVMKQASWPVIAVPDGASFKTFKKIGIACDLKNGIDHIPAEYIKNLVHDFNASLHILNSTNEPEKQSEIIQEASALMDLLSPVHHEYHFINNSDNDNGIIDFTEKNNVDLLILLPKKHTLFDKWTQKSHTKKMVLHLHIPVMALHFTKP